MSVYLMYLVVLVTLFFFFFKQKTAYEMRISDWSSDVCSSDLCRIELSQTDGTHNVPPTARTEVAALAVQPASPSSDPSSPCKTRWTNRLATVRSDRKSVV